jgi:crotonobetainyl-CoA:carnitine CoA-transferase CaiB-like acyl-CoA transferase
MIPADESTSLATLAPVLAGLRVLEIGHYVAAPFCTRLLADLGADVIKIEPPTGDPARQWGEMVNGRSLWWSMHGRNKRSVTINLKSEKGRELVLKLVAESDAVVENFRPGQLKRMGLGPERLRQARPGLIVVHISGYGQDGPSAQRAAFGVIGEAIGGLRFLTNHAPGKVDLPPVRVGVSIGDSIAGLYAAFGLMTALWQRDRVGGDRQSRTIDVALTESILSMMEGMLPEYGALGKVKQPTGGAIATAAPSNAYPSADGQWVLIAANSEPLFARLMTLIGRSDLIGAPGYANNPDRVANASDLDHMIGQWSRCHTADILVKLLNSGDIPNSKAYNAADCATDPQYLARGMVREVPDRHFGTVLQAGMVPHIPESPGMVRWAGPDVGEHNQMVLSELLGLDSTAIDTLKKEGVL